MSHENNILYKENQKQNLKFAETILILYSGYLTYVTVKQVFFEIPYTAMHLSNTFLLIVWFIFAIITPMLFFSATLDVIISENGIFYRFFPIIRKYKKIEFEDIEEIEIVKYHPLKEYGGWGIRFNATSNAFTISGDKGVLIKLKNHDKKLLLGSEAPDEIKKIVDNLIQK